MKNTDRVLFKLLEKLPDASEKEICEQLFRDGKISVERITSKGQVSSDGFWYDEKRNEFVVVLQGQGIVLFDDNREFLLKKGDSLLIKSHQRHKVIFTDKREETLWLAFFWE